MRIKLSADSACDLPSELVERCQISIFPLSVAYGDISGQDGVDVFPKDIFAYVDGGGSLPTTSAVNIGTFQDSFSVWSREYDAVLHISLGSEFSSCYRNACVAAEEYPNVYVVDSQNLSSGFGHLVLEAADRIAEGKNPETIVEELKALAPKVSTSFVLGRLDYMRKGGRCTAVELLGANLLKLRPIIRVNEGKMGMAGKLRGSLEKTLREYVKQQLQDRQDLVLHRIFITDSGVGEDMVAAVTEEVQKYAAFEEILYAKAGVTISSHCGNACLGILFLTK